MPVYGIIGNPVEHSLSAPMQEAAFEALGIDARFCRFQVSQENLTAAVKGAQALSIDGLTVTMPHKRAVLDLGVIEPSDAARLVGAVNTIDMHEMRGYITDGYGCVRALREHDVTLDSTQVLVVGAGGAGRAIGVELAKAGASIDITNVELDMAVELAEIIRDLGRPAEAHSLDDLDALVDDAAVLIDATSVGMNENRALVGPEALRSDLVVFDVVYTPMETRLIHNAHEADAQTISGAWMLLYQGARAFEIWTGQDAPIEAMKNALWGYLNVPADD
jgi:shikimate dehydrogenase